MCGGGWPWPHPARSIGFRHVGHSGKIHSLVGSLSAEPYHRMRHARHSRLEAALQSKKPAERREAAEILGKRHKMRSFLPLVRALQREEIPKVQAAILTALRNIGGATHPEPERATLSLGYGPLFQFMIDNVAKPKLMEVAFDAFGYTGTIDAVLLGGDGILKLAEFGGHEDSAALAHRFYMDLVCAH